MKKKSIAPFLLLFCITTFSFSQSHHTSSVNIDKTKVFENYVKQGYGSPKIYMELANHYYFNNNYKKAKYWFEKLNADKTITDKQLLFRYKQTLKALGLCTSLNNKELETSGTN